MPMAIVINTAILMAIAINTGALMANSWQLMAGFSILINSAGGGEKQGRGPHTCEET